MKLLLNQYFPFTPADVTETVREPEAVKQTNAEYLLFVRSEEPTRAATTAFLKTHFEQGRLDDLHWRLYLDELKKQSVQLVPSFALLQLTNPVSLLLYGFCQAIHCSESQILDVFKPKTVKSIARWDVSAVRNGSWLLGYSDHTLRQPLAETALNALQQTRTPLESFWFEHFLEEQEAERHFNLFLVHVQEVIDLEVPCTLEPIRAQLRQMATYVRPHTKTLIDNCLREKKVAKDFFGRVIKPDYEALAKAFQEDLELKRKEIAVLEQNADLRKMAFLEGDLARKDLEINELQTKITTLTQQVGMMELVQKGAAATQKELDELKESFKTLTLEKKQLVQQLKELQSVQNQSVTQQNGLLNQLKVAQAEKEYLQRVQNQAVAEKNQLSKQLENLQQVHNSLVTEKDRWFQQLKTAQLNLSNLQTEKDKLQSVHNQSVMQNDSLLRHLKDVELQLVQNQSVTEKNALYQQLKDAQSNLSNLQTEKDKLQSVHNQYVTQNEALFQIAQAEIKRLQKLLDLKEEAAKQPQKPIIEKPIIITKPVVKTKLPFEPEMILVEGGTFKMGSNEYDDEKPIHQVTLGRFMIGKYPITQAQWKAVMGNNPSHFKGDDLPVECVSWGDAQQFIITLNSKTGKTYSLPTEAQWEFAARGGNKSKGYEYSGSDDLNKVGWFWENSGDKPLSGDWDYNKISENNCKTYPVGGKAANELLIHDMSGNVWEWCSDWYGSYSDAAVTNPTGATEGTYRVLRGGSWFNVAVLCRVAFRRGRSPSDRYSNYGFRVVSFP